MKILVWMPAAIWFTKTVETTTTKIIIVNFSPYTMSIEDRITMAEGKSLLVHATSKNLT